MESAVGDFVPKNGFKFTYYLTRSMRVSGVVIFLLLDKSAVSVKASCPPPGLKSDHTLVIINHHANPLLIVIVIFFGCFHPPPSLWWKWLWKFKMVLTADLPDFADGSDLPDGAGSTGWCWSTWWTPRGWFQGWPQTLWSPGSTQWPGFQPLEEQWSCIMHGISKSLIDITHLPRKWEIHGPNGRYEGRDHLRI